MTTRSKALKEVVFNDIKRVKKQNPYQLDWKWKVAIFLWRCYPLFWTIKSSNSITTTKIDQCGL